MGFKNYTKEEMQELYGMLATEHDVNIDDKDSHISLMMQALKETSYRAEILDYYIMNYSDDIPTILMEPINVPLQDIPLMINDPDRYKRTIVKWRLIIGK